MSSPVSTVHPENVFAQVQIRAQLCTSCGGVGALVEDRGKEVASLQAQADSHSGAESDAASCCSLKASIEWLNA